jgi:hypothetical protein
MTTKLKIGLGLLLLVLATVYFYYEDSLPPRTPIKIARLISGLSISSEITFEKPIDTWAPNGDGEVLVKGILSDKELNDLIEDAKANHYRTLPIKEDLGTIIILNDLIKIQKGFYKIEIDTVDTRDYNLTIIDIDKKELIAYLTVQ